MSQVPLQSAADVSKLKQIYYSSLARRVKVNKHAEWDVGRELCVMGLLTAFLCNGQEDIGDQEASADSAIGKVLVRSWNK